jgi:hypothetical protein
MTKPPEAATTQSWNPRQHLVSGSFQYLTLLSLAIPQEEITEVAPTVKGYHKEGTWPRQL